jgi:transcriptional regulator NrdR family protein
MFDKVKCRSISKRLGTFEAWSISPRAVERKQDVEGLFPQENLVSGDRSSSPE